MTICKRCGEPVCDRSKCYCEYHLSENRRYYAEAARRRKKSGVCVSCGDCLAATSKRWCVKHLESQRLKQNEYRTRHGWRPTKYQRLKTNAKKRGIELLLTETQFNEWFNQQPKCCCYCGISAEDLSQIGRAKGFLSIDRKNSDKPYAEKNMCLACMRCNNLKSNFFTEEEWVEICNRFVKPRLAKYHMANCT